MRRFYCENLRPGVCPLDETDTRHARTVLRLSLGDAVELFDGCGNTAAGPLVEVNTDDAFTQPGDSQRAGGKRRTGKAARDAIGVLVSEVMHRPAPRPALTLIVAANKSDRPAWLVEKCTELGVSRINFARFERSVVVLTDNHLAKLRRRAIEAAKQSQNPWLPMLTGDARCADAAREAQPRGVALAVADLVTAAQPARDWLARVSATADEIAIVIGPEGGLTDAERDALFALPAQPITLAPYVLRVETAAIATAALVAGYCR